MTTETYDPNGLFAGDFPIVTRKVTLLSGQVQPRGAVLGRITASDKYILSLSGASDGSQVPRLILAEAYDATGADKEVAAYDSGEFNGDKLTYGTGHTAATVEAAFRQNGASIFVRTLP